MAERWELTGWEATAAAYLVRLVDDRLPDSWTRHEDGPGMWRWSLDDEDWPLVVVVNAREDRVLVPVRGWPSKVGPTVMAGYPGDLFASVTLPNVSDGFDSRQALEVLSRVVPALAAPDWSASTTTATPSTLVMLLAAIDNALRNGSYMTNANLAFELLCDRFGVDRESLTFDPQWSAECTESSSPRSGPNSDKGSADPGLVDEPASNLAAGGDRP